MIRYLAALIVLLTPLNTTAAEKSCETPQATAIVDGMVCDFCAQGLKKVFLKDPAVKDVQVDLTTKEVKILLRSGQQIDDVLINKNVDWAGYKVTKITHGCAAPEKSQSGG